MAKHTACPLQVFGLYRKAGDPGDMVIQKRFFAIDDIRVPGTATPFAFHLQSGLRTYSNRILQVRLHQGAGRLISPGLQYIALSLSQSAVFMGCCAGTYVAWLIPHQSREVHDLLPSTILQIEKLLGSVTEGEYELLKR